MSLRLCMIGCGSFAQQFHGPAQVRCAREDPSVQRIACCDTSLERVRQYATAFGFARTYTDTREMLERERPQAVIMAVPPVATCAAALPVLESGYPLLLEKPPGNSLAELLQLRAAAARGGAKTQVGFNRRHMPVMRAALGLLRREFSGGDPWVISYEMARHERWDADFSTTAIHAVDAACVLAGAESAGVDLRVLPRVSGDRRAVDATLEFECVSGARVRVEIRPVAGFNAETAVVHGRGQSLRLTVPFPSGPFSVGRLEHWRANACVSTYTDEALEPLERMGVYDETRVFLDAVRNGGAPIPGLGETRQQVEMMELLRHGQPGRFSLTAADAHQ